jgi:hypothetical protein
VTDEERGECQRREWGGPWVDATYHLRSPLAKILKGLDPGETWEDGMGNEYRKMEET